MTPAHAHLVPALVRCTHVLEFAPALRADFEVWAVTVLDELCEAAGQGRQSLQWHAMPLRLELLDLQRTVARDFAVTGGTKVSRMARRDWLEAVLKLVDALLDDSTPAAAA